ncbi:stressosome-associated protein Prli42 [Staphylococcus sp. H16/1A]|uniref:Stressosome-associated protein Prli42 n=1 Tax=Staphylococcus canis TaxID=2724942 RepID=A0ABS0T9B2_9STAP|nr:stressosome-associated protein Prli42 [Staphylococcus canis]
MKLQNKGLRKVLLIIMLLAIIISLLLTGVAPLMNT